MAEAEPATVAKGASATVMICGVSSAMPNVVNEIGTMTESSVGSARRARKTIIVPPRHAADKAGNHRTMPPETRRQEAKRDRADEIETGLHEHGKTVLRRCEARHVDENERQHRGLGIKRADRTANHHRRQHEARIDGKRRIGGQHTAGPGMGAIRHAGFRHEKTRQGQRCVTKRDHDEKHPPASRNIAASTPPTTGPAAGPMPSMMPMRFMIRAASMPEN